jgi:magnesium-transporting ATPase (P-type)
MVPMKKILVLAVAILVLASPFLAAAQDSPIKDVAGLKNVLKKIADIIQWIFWIAAIVSAFWAGFLYLTAAGETEKLSKARKQLWYTVVAIVIALLSTGLPALIENILTPS